MWQRSAQQRQLSRPSRTPAFTDSEKVRNPPHKPGDFQTLPYVSNEPEPGPDDFDTYADRLDHVDQVVNELCTPEYLNLKLAWIKMAVQLLPDVDLLLR